MKENKQLLHLAIQNNKYVYNGQKGGRKTTNQHYK